VVAKKLNGCCVIPEAHKARQHDSQKLGMKGGDLG